MNAVREAAWRRLTVVPADCAELYRAEVRGSEGDLSDVGRLVYLMFKKTAADTEPLADALFEEGRRTAEETLLQEAHAVGCAPLSVHLQSGWLLSWIRDRADWAAQKIADTYNQELVSEILRIIAEVPTANRWVIAYRVQAWDATRQVWKIGQVGSTEAFVVSNEVKLQFYEMNKVVEPEAWFGYSLQCEICQDIAAHNPHTLAEAESIGLPHVGCMDRWDIRGGETVACDELWLGE
jgi:hypothetical protein